MDLSPSSLNKSWGNFNLYYMDHLLSVEQKLWKIFHVQVFYYSYNLLHLELSLFFKVICVISFLLVLPYAVLDFIEAIKSLTH